MTFRNITAERIEIKYMYAFLWSVSIMVTYTLSFPESHIEILFILIELFIMTGVFGYCLNRIGFILEDFKKTYEKEENERKILNKYI